MRNIDSSPQDLDDFQYFLYLASLFHSAFSVDWIVELTGKKASQVLSALEKGVRESCLVRKGLGLYDFSNLKKRQEWENHLAPEEKEELTVRIVELLLSELPDNDTKAEIIAHYLLCLSNDEARCCWLMKAGDSYLRNFRSNDALQCYSKILNDLYAVQGEQTDSLFCEAAIKYSKISTARHDTTKVVSILQQAQTRAKRWNKTTLETLLQMHLAKNEWLLSRYESAMRYFEQGRDTAEQLDDPKLLRSVNTFSTFFFYWQGRFREAIQSYEKSISDVEKYPKDGFPLLASLTVGHCYVQVGQITQGLGMMDSIRKHCQEKGNLSLAAHAGVVIGATLLDIRRLDVAIQYLECSIKEAIREHNEWAQILARLMLAFAYYLKRDNRRVITYLDDFLKQSRDVQVIVQPFPYLIELSLAMEDGTLSRIPPLSLAEEVRKSIEGKNIFMKGIAFRYQALMQKKEFLPHETIIQSLNLSVEWLNESGHQIELAKTLQELAREYILVGDEAKAKEITLIASNILSPFNEAMVPNDLRPLIESPMSMEKLLKDILKLGQEMVTIRDNQDLVQRIISTVNRITGAERGAIFIIEGDDRYPKLQLRGSKNLTPEEIAHPNFEPSMKMVKKVIRTRKGLIFGTRSTEGLNLLCKEVVHSCICVPMILRDKLIGVLYHDNRLLSSAFKKSDLEILSYFAALAAIALDNARVYEEIQKVNQRLKEEKLYYKEQHLESIHFENIVGESSAIMQVLAKVNQVAKTNTTILVLGETGVGKELVARAIHHLSPRCDGPFIVTQCSTLPDGLIQTELFGHERGAFTGAIRQRIGRFELADKGTVFLDEIGDLPLEIQLHLLRVLETKAFERVGGRETICSDFRLIAATNCDLEQQIKARRFRPDLYYRLNVFPIYVPPLRERKEDIPSLTQHFLKIYSTKIGKTFERIADKEMDRLIQYNWPGNIRELENIIERATILSYEPHFQVFEFNDNNPQFREPGMDITLKDNERGHILWALQKAGWKVRGRGGAAEILEVHPSTLAFKMKKLGIQRPPKSRYRKNRHN